MAARNWYLVADSSRARLFAAARDGEGFAEIASFSNAEGRSQDSELASYDAGLSARAAPRSGPQQPSAVDHNVELFAKELARYLEQARTEHRYDALCLVAAPEFLGRLRQSLSKEVERLVVEQLDKDISWFDGAEIERHLKRRVAAG